ncbi:hypothetical protein KIN20_036049 [Parelaphostrongylus tenuis]|uniref:Uncharacterized protein n=1 Tax=Parelaphostrongylus tenuis TaxID=148309 RepID=A0AAD5WL07_PARTN|nr:hypothetical protein KIN20_036049 [Parelaphostrongylus tenuis]
MRDICVKEFITHFSEDDLHQMFAEKFENDRAVVRQAIMIQTTGCADKIKELRFLIAAVQTFGNVDGMCLMAEYAMNEFSLRDGVLDKEFHSNETHRKQHYRPNTNDKRQV